MKGNQKTKDGIVFLEIQGEIDLYASPQLREHFTELAKGKQHKIIINLKNVTYIDSSGLATFIEAFQKLSAEDGKLVLCNLTETVKGVFEIARLEDVLTIVDTEEDALKVAQ